MSAAVTELLRAGYMGRLPDARLLQLLTGLDNKAAAQRCFVAEEIFRRWRSDRRPNPTAMRLTAIGAGYVPWRGWFGREVHEGLLMPPGAVADRY